MIKKSTAVKFLILVIITIISLITLKLNPNLKTPFYKYVYDSNISFATINNWYQSKFGSPLPFSDFFNDTVPVFNENLKYTEADKYKDGVSLKVGYDYLTPSLDNGIVIFVGEKEGYGDTIIVQQENGIDVWYSNLKEESVKLYDYIKKGDLIGSVDENLYLVFIKDGVFLNYEEYL